MVAATEVLIATLAVRNIIRNNRLHELRSYLELGEREGMHSLENSVQLLLKQRLVDQEALREVGSNLIVASATEEERPKRSRWSRWFSK
jgi:twitching motility protein PilT